MNLLSQWNRSCYSSCNWSHRLVKFMIIHCHPPRPILFCRIGQLNGVRWESPAQPSPKPPMAALIPAVPPGTQCHFGSLGGGYPSGFTWPFPPEEPSLRRSGKQYGILPAAEGAYSNPDWNWGNRRRMGSGTHWTHCEVDLS